MYTIKCDGYILHDPRDDEGKLLVQNPKCKLEVNTVGEASFSIFENHPFYSRLQKMRSIFEIQQDGEPIFRGRMTDDTQDFNNTLLVDLEGVLAFFNDSIVRPFMYPENFQGTGYDEAASSGNVVEYFLKWLIDNHNEQVQEFQRFKLGKVTVADPNNYITRASTEYLKTWDVLKTKLFESGLGGFLCIRYEEDGNYIDYLEDFEFVNTQRVVYGENLLDLTTESDASATYSAIIPFGKKMNEIDEASDDDSRLTILALPDGDITDDIVKDGDTLYSKSTVERVGWIYAPVQDTTWEDVMDESNLQSKGVEYLVQTATKLLNTITITAIDLHYSDAEVESFRIYRYVRFESKPHELTDLFRLTKLELDLMNPQNTKITIGDQIVSLTDINSKAQKTLSEKVDNIVIQTTTHTTDIAEIQNIVMEQSTAVVSTCEDIILAALQSYVETSNYESLKETIQTQLQVLADQLSVQITETVQRIEDVDGDLQEKFNTITKYFTFDINGLTIGQVDNPNKVVIDNDEISILVNGIVVQRFDSNGKALIPELNVTRALNLFGYLIDQDENGNVNCEYIESTIDDQTTAMLGKALLGRMILNEGL